MPASCDLVSHRFQVEANPLNVKAAGKISGLALSELSSILE